MRASDVNTPKRQQNHRHPAWLTLGLVGSIVPVLLTGCGGHSNGGSGSTPTPTATATATPTPTATVSVTLTPSAVTLVTGGTQTFSAAVTNVTSQTVTWTVQETGGGTVTSAGVYTAPTTAGTYHVVATSTADSSKTATATVTVQAAPSAAVTISPVAITLAVGGTQTFAATIANSTSQAVTWSVQEGSGGGTITTTGLYTAPSTPGTYHIIATDTANTSLTASATVTVLGGASAITVQ